MRKWLVLTIGFLLGFSGLHCQDSLLKMPRGYLEKVSSKASQVETKLDNKSEKALRQIRKQEERIRRKLSKIDSTAAKNVFNTTKERYKQLEQKLKNPGKLGQYLPKLDTMATSLKFLEGNPQLLANMKDGKGKLDATFAKVKGMESQFQKAEDIKQFLRERKQYLKEQLSKFGFAKELKKINKQAWYYNQQVSEYKEMLKDSKKAERKAIELLSKTKLFRDFMKKNSMLAALFPVPGGSVSGQGSQAGFAGLQTRAQLTSFIQQAGMGATNTMSQFQQNIQGAQSQLTQLRNKLSQLAGAGGNDLEMPDFKPNSQKTKSFFKRLEYSTTIQSQKSSAFFPATSDLGLSVGYKPDDKSVIGIGASYKIGLGKGWNNIKLSNEGIGLRSFIDWKIKETFWLSGGYEQNYKSRLNGVVLTSPGAGTREVAAWQQSGLLGLSKTVSLKSKFLKKTKIQLLWDFLSYQQIPKTQPLLFRVGYCF